MPTTKRIWRNGELVYYTPKSKGRSRRSISVSADFYAALSATVDQLQAQLSTRAARRQVSLASVIESALAGFEPSAEFVERVRHNGRQAQLANPPPVRVSLPAGLGDPRLPQPTGRAVLADVPVAVSDELYEMVDDQVTRAAELEQRDVSHGQLFEAAIKLALRAAERERKQAA